MSLQLIVSQYQTQLQQLLGLQPYTSVAIWDGIGQVIIWSKQFGYQFGPIFISYLAILHAARVCQFIFNHHDPHVPTLQRWVAFIILSFGGTTLSSVLLARTPGWITRNDPLIVHSMIYLLYQYTPLLRIMNILGTPMRIIVAIGDGITRGLAITTITIDTIQLHSLSPLNQSFVACILCGTLAGCGGGIINSIFGGIHELNWILTIPSLSIDAILSICMAVSYTWLTTWNIIDRIYAQGIICILCASALVINVLITDIQSWRSKKSLPKINNNKIKDKHPSINKRSNDIKSNSVKSKKLN